MGKVRTSVSQGARPEPMGLGSRFVGILFSPGETFSHIVAAPSWVAMLALTSIVSALFVGGFLSTEVGQEAWLDQALRSALSFGAQINEAQRQQMERIMPYVGVLGAVQFLVVAPLMSLGLAGVLFVVFSVALGATASFKQQFSVVVHSAVIIAVSQVFISPLNYFREEMTSPTTLAVFLPMLDEESWAYRALSVIDLFYIWWIMVLAIGLSVLYQRKAKPIALSLFAVYALLALAMAAVFGGS